MDRFRTLLVLSLIIAVGGFLRLYHLESFPPALNWDEVSHAYNALSLLHTGADQWGKILPIGNFRAYGDYPLPLNLYFTSAVFALLGPSDFSARLPHALIGTLCIFIVFHAAYLWSKNKKIAVLSALFMAMDPWTFFPSRAVFQSNWSVLLSSLGLVYILNNNYSFSALFSGLSLYAYHNTRIFSPLLMASQIPKFIRSKMTWLWIVLFFIPAVVILFSPQSRARSTWVGILDTGAIGQIEHQRNTSRLPALLSRLVYNRPLFVVTKVLTNYVGYFSPKFLFLSGGTQYQYSIPHFGVLPIVSLPFFYIGLTLLLFRKDKLLLTWLLLAPLPAAITRDQYAVIRATTMLPIVQIVTASGLVFVATKYSKIILISTVILYLTLSANYFFYYFSQYPKMYSASWQYGYSQLAEFVRHHYSEYDEIIITKRHAEPHEFLLWNLRWSSDKLLKDPNFAWDYHANWYWVDGFDKFKFVNDWDIQSISASSGKHVLVFSSQDHPKSGADLGKILFLDGTTAFNITAL